MTSTGVQNCERLLTQDEGRTQQRNRILAEIEKLEQARRFLEDLKKAD